MDPTWDPDNGLQGLGAVAVCRDVLKLRLGLRCRERHVKSRAS